VTVIVGVEKEGVRVIASDSQVYVGGDPIPLENLSMSKLLSLGGVCVGVSGPAIWLRILRQVYDKMAQGGGVDLDSEEGIFEFGRSVWREMESGWHVVDRDPLNQKGRFLGSLDANFMFANRVGLYVMDPDLGVYRYRRYASIGSGCDFAMGSLHRAFLVDEEDCGGESLGGESWARLVARTAVVAACDLSSTCDGPVALMTVEGEA